MWNSVEIKKICQKYNIKTTKRYGQNFLIDQNILKKITNVVDIKNKNVIEIGPGLGSLSLHLLNKVKNLTSYEIDKNIINFLKNEINNENFKLIEGDFLKQKLNFKNKKILVANIPYNITSDILFKLFKNSQKFSHAVIMIQKEVAERLNSKVGSKNYGKLAISAKYFADIKYKFTVPSNAFLPIPKIESAVILLTFKEKQLNRSKEFLEFIKNCFAMRRKTLFNNLKKYLGVEKASEIIVKNNLTSKVRPQEITYKKYLSMFKKI